MTFADITNDLAPELRRLNEIIAEALATPTPLMNEIVTRYLQSKGKQIRPVMVMLSARLLGSVTDRVLHAAASMEMLHNASLIHDDVVDDTLTRRGRRTINAIWDNHIAVLVGDYFMSGALNEGVLTGSLPIVEALSELGKELSLGEIHQICNAREQQFRIADYFTAIRKKTASLFMQCARVGAEAVDAPAELSRPLVMYAEQLGLCFQIRDDIFDYFSDDEIGKPTGNDLREGKVTLPLLHALQVAPADQSDRMKELIRRGNLTDTEIQSLIQFTKDNGGIEFAYSEMERLHTEALPWLLSYPDSPTRDALRDIFTFIIARKN